jgi:ubiquinone/menaquinone biosynthesis C-methylase UbiE
MRLNGKLIFNGIRRVIKEICSLLRPDLQKVDYNGEAEFIKKVLKKHQHVNGNEMRDIACGTGNHALLIQDEFQITGLDINPEMLKIPVKRFPNVNFIQGEHEEVGSIEYDLINCLFSAISYNTSYIELESTIEKFQAHLKLGGC